MHIVGTLLWLGRNCYPELSQGLSQLCGVMSKPNQEAFEMWLVKRAVTLEKVPNRAIRFAVLDSYNMCCRIDVPNGAI